MTHLPGVSDLSGSDMYCKTLTIPPGIDPLDGQ